MTPCTDRRGPDKILHILAGALICISFGMIAAVFFTTIPWLSLAIALSAVAVAAVSWEIFRKIINPANHICIWDILWTLAGGIITAWHPWLIAHLLAVSH